MAFGRAEHYLASWERLHNLWRELVFFNTTPPLYKFGLFPSQNQPTMHERPRRVGCTALSSWRLPCPYNVRGVPLSMDPLPDLGIYARRLRCVNFAVRKKRAPSYPREQFRFRHREPLHGGVTT